MRTYATSRRAILAAMAAGVFVHARGVWANVQDFETWLAELKQEARVRGIAEATLAQALDGVAPIDRVIELDRKQPEFVLTFEQYLDRVVSEARVEKGRRFLAEHRALLAEVERRYAVQPRFVIALWGVESDFGRLTGDFNVVAALATLAYDGRRSAFFRKELLDALKILDEGHITPVAMTGSWAGAMGQNQFMPSSFLAYAVDFDGDGRRDIWTSTPDVFASIANYLASYQWRGTETWGRPVRLPSRFDPTLIGLDIRKDLRYWRALGVKSANGGPLPEAAMEASIVQPAGPGGPAYLAYDNYRVVMRWNRSLYFATAVGLLADRVARS